MDATISRRTSPNTGIRRRRGVIGAASLLVAGLAAMFAGGGATLGLAYLRKISRQPSEPAIAGQPVAGLTTSVKTTSEPLESGLMKWRVDWSLCWDPAPNAIGYDLQVLTIEGISRRLTRLMEPCLEVEVASGEHSQDRIEREKGIQMSLQGTQLSYRVRAALPDNRVTEWSRAVSAGEDLGAMPR